MSDRLSVVNGGKQYLDGSIIVEARQIFAYRVNDALWPDGVRFTALLGNSEFSYRMGTGIALYTSNGEEEVHEGDWVVQYPDAEDLVVIRPDEFNARFKCQY